VLVRVVSIYAVLGLVLAALHGTEPEEPVAENRAEARTEEPSGIPTVELEPPPKREVVEVLPPGDRLTLRPREIRKLILPPERRALTDGRRAALQAMLANDIFLLYVGLPEKDRNDSATGIPMVSIGDSADPQLDTFVDDFNSEMLHAYERGLIGNVGAGDVWFLAANLRHEADEVFFELLHDPEDAIVLRREGKRMVVLDIGRDHRVRKGTRFLIWTRRASPRLPIAIVEVVDVRGKSCAALVRHRFREDWPPNPALRASNPFYAARRELRVRFVGDPGRLHADAPARLRAATGVHLARDGLVDVAIIGDFENWSVLQEVADAGALLVPARLVPWFVPSTQGER
jgi:hypothetical protein